MTEPRPRRTPAGRRRAPPPVRVPEPALDTMFGRFWPDAGVPGNIRAVLACVGVGLLAAIILPFRDLGIGTFVVLLAAGGVVLGFSANRRSPFTLTCAALCALLAATVFVRDAEWIVDPLPPGRHRPLHGRARQRPHPAGLRAGRHRLAARRTARAALARSLAAHRHRGGDERRGAAHHRLVGARGARLRPAVRLRRRDLRRVGWSAGAGPEPRQLRAARVHHRRRGRRGAGGDVPRPEPGPRRADVRSRAAGRAPLRVADAGAAGRRGLPGVPRGAGLGHLRRARVRREHHRTHLRRLRAPGLRPAHRRDRAHPARRLGGRPQGAAGHAPGPGLAARVARPALPAHPGRRRVRALPDARLPGGLRLHPAPPAGRRVRGAGSAWW